jgi:hypothetical protein
MLMKNRFVAIDVLVGCLAVVLAASAAWAQEATVSPLGTEDAPPAAAATDVNASELPPLREQTIYIPYRKLKGVFEEDGRGVFIPYEKFQELWAKARLADEPQPDTPPPFGAVITEIESEATVEADVVRVRAEVAIELLGKGWHEIPLRLADAAVRAATLDGEPARVVVADDGSSMLLVEHDDDAPRNLSLSLDYSKAYAKSPGQNSVSFESPRAAVNRWRIRVPQAGVTVNVQPMLAAAEVPADGGDGEAPGADETVVVAFVGPATNVRIDWTPKAEGASGMAAVASVQSRQEVTVDEGLLRTRAELVYNVSRAELPQLVVDVPAGQKITRVVDANVRQWDVAEIDGLQRITADLFEPVRGQQQLSIELEQILDEASRASLVVPTVQAVGVSRQQGVVVVRLAEELRGEAAVTEGLLQLDATELPEPLRTTPWDFAYRAAAMPFSLVLEVEAVQPRIEAQQLIEAYVEPNQLVLDVATIFGIEDAGVFQLELAVPAGYEVRRVQGRALGDSPPVNVDTFHLADDGTGRLSINLASKALGRVGLIVTLIRPLDDPNLLSATGESSTLEIPLPTIVTSVRRVSGRLVVLGPESLQLTTTSRSKLQDVAVVDARSEVPSVRDGRAPGLREVMAFAYAQDAASLTLSAERRRPQVTVRQLLAVDVESGVVNSKATFSFDVAYSPVSSLRIDLPAEVAGIARMPVNSGIAKRVLDPQPEDVGEGDVALEFTGEGELLGQVVVPLTWEKVVPELSVGESGEYPLPVLTPRGVDRAWGQILVSKAETLDIRPAPGLTGLRPIDPQHDLMPGASGTDVARAFEFTDTWGLTVTATRYELEEVKRASIERAVVRMVVTRSDEITVQAIYRVRSVLQRLAVTLPAGSQFDMDMLTINGQPQPLERGEGEQLFIPLIAQGPDQPCLVEMRYTLPGTYAQLDLPVFPEQEGVATEPAVQKVSLVVSLPDELAVLEAHGPWTNEQKAFFAQLNGLPWSQGDDSDLLSWVSEGVAVDQARLRSFATDGRSYRFTALRPSPPPDGSLQIVAVDERLVTGGVLAGLALLGLVFVRSRLSTKLVVLVLLAMGMVALGILMPMLALQMVDQYFAAGLAGVVLLWLVGSATRRRPRTAAVPVSAATPKSEVSAAPAELASDIVIEDEAESREGDEDHA